MSTLVTVTDPSPQSLSRRGCPPSQPGGPGAWPGTGRPPLTPSSCCTPHHLSLPPLLSSPAPLASPPTPSSSLLSEQEGRTCRCRPLLLPSPPLLPPERELERPRRGGRGWPGGRWAGRLSAVARWVGGRQ